MQWKPYEWGQDHFLNLTSILFNHEFKVEFAKI